MNNQNRNHTQQGPIILADDHSKDDSPTELNMSMKNSKISYFVTENHENAEMGVRLLSNRLVYKGWELVLSKISIQLKFSKGEDIIHLSTSTLKDPDCGNTVYQVNGNYVSLRGWLEWEGRTERGYTFDEQTTWQEHKYRLRGSTEVISMLISEGGTYVVAFASAETHSMLSGYYDLAKEPPY